MILGVDSGRSNFKCLKFVMLGQSFKSAIGYHCISILMSETAWSSVHSRRGQKLSVEGTLTSAHTVSLSWSELDQPELSPPASLGNLNLGADVTSGASNVSLS